MSQVARRSMSGADAMWLYADRPNHLMVIDGMMWTDEPLDWDLVEEVLSERLVGRFPVFSQRAVDPAWPWELPVWEDDPDFTLDRHVTRATLPDPGGEEELQAFLEAQVAEPLDRAKPLWHVWFIDNYLGGSVLFYRFHHAMADGMALAEVMVNLTDPSPDTHEPFTAREVHHSGTVGSLLGGAIGLVRNALHVSSLPALGMQSAAVAQKLLLDALPVSLFSGEPGGAKRLAWSRARSVDEIKQVSRATESTVNDVLIAALSGALARFLDLHGETVDHLTTMVPVNTRPPGRALPRELGNKFALVMLHLPTGNLDTRARLHAVHERMEEIKHSPETFITSVVAEGIGHLHAVEKPFVDFFAAKAVGVTTNVIGPKEPRYIAGRKIAGVLGWVPGSGGHTLGVCIYSYDNTVRIGFKTDAETVPMPERLIEFFDAELDALLELVPQA